MSVSTNRLCPPPACPTVRGLLIVARDQVDLYQTLQAEYDASETLTVLLDRRQGYRRRAVQTVMAEQRRGDRRSPLSTADDLRFQPYVLVRPHYRRPPD